MSDARAIEQALARAKEERVAERLLAADATLWGPAGTPEIANRLGWLTIAQRMREQLPTLKAFAEEVRSEGTRDVVLLGMGGSSLAAEVLRRSFGPVEGWPTLHVLDSTDAGTIAAVGGQIDPKRTLFLVSSKSGGTIEPLSMWAHFWSLQPDGGRFVAITDPGSGLERLAQEHGFRRVFAGDPDIGGRYSALSPFGIVPAALAGWDVEALLAGGEAEEDPEWLRLGVALSALATAGRDKLTIFSSGRIASIGLWLEQLVAESTGKQGRGILPVAEEPLLDPESYGKDRVFLHIRDAGVPDATLDAGVAALADAGHPTFTLEADGPRDLGRIFMLSELAVAVAGWGLGINPFDQPNVQQAKDATNAVLAEYESTGKLPAVSEADDIALSVLVGEATAGEYVALMGYVQPSAEWDAEIAQLREAIVRATKATTTFGYGPRFLHSTGQYHKGGPKTGRFLQLVHDDEQDVAIPGRPFTFTTLKNAQALGDLRTLRELELPAEQVRLRGDPVRALRELSERIREGL